MTENQVLDAIPEFYRRWISADFARDWFSNLSLPIESLNCADCAMVRPKGLTRDLGPFDPRVKCCSYHPFLPSFSIGSLVERALAGPSGFIRHSANGESGQRWSFDQRLDRYLANSRCTPVGAFARSSKRKPTSICETGKHLEDRCPFLSDEQNASCTIFAHRPSTCAGYVCRSGDGARGLKGWRDWESRLAEFEWTMAHAVLFELGLTLDDADEEFQSIDQAKKHYQLAYHKSLTLNLSSNGDWSTKEP